MGFLSRLFRRSSEVTRTVQGDRQVLGTDVWRVVLPLNWAQVSQTESAISFETPDKAKGLNITTIHLDSNASAKASDIAKQFQEITKTALARMEGYTWVFLQDDQVQTANGCLATLDAHDPQRGYRIYSKAIVQIPFALRASFHDYDCKSIVESRAYFDKPFESLRINGPG